MDELNSEQIQTPAQIIEKPTAVWVFGVLNIVFGCYHLFFLSVSTYKTVIEMQKHPENTRRVIAYFLISCAVTAFFWIWLIVAGAGLLKMKKWSRRCSIIYSWVQIGLFVALWSYNIITMYGMPELDRRSFFIALMLNMLYALTYPILLLIFMQTQKVKKAFAAVGGVVQYG
jgi:hypothetical protein